MTKKHKKKKKVYRQTDKQTNIITEKAKTIYPLYTSYRGYNQMTKKHKKKKKVYRQTDKQTNIITEKAKTIYPLYTSYRGYNDPACKDLNTLTVR